MSEYLEELRTAMLPLSSEFALREVLSSEDPRTVKLRLANSSAGADVEVNWQELRVFVTLFKVSQHTSIREWSDLRQPHKGERYGFDADDLFQLRGVADAPVGGRLLRKAPGEINRVVGRYVDALRLAGRDVLQGDFAILQEIAKLVSQRALS